MKSNKEVDKKLGLMFKEKRQELGMSQTHVTKWLKYSSPQFLSNFERGLCLLPLKKLGVLIQLYGMDAEQVTDLILGLQRQFLKSELTAKPIRARAKGKAKAK